MNTRNFAVALDSRLRGLRDGWRRTRFYTGGKAYIVSIREISERLYLFTYDGGLDVLDRSYRTDIDGARR